MRKKLLSLLCMGVMTLSMFAGCGSSQQSASTSDAGTEGSATEGVEAEVSSDPITISFWCNFTGSDGDVLREIVDNYNKTNTDNITVEIDIMDYATLQSKLPTAISTGTGPSFILAGVELIKQLSQLMISGMLQELISQTSMRTL